jgi:hypothetical protein
MTRLAPQIENYARDRGEHGHGTVSSAVLEAVERLVDSGEYAATAETGCGKTTILLSNLSRSHFVFAVDDTGAPGSSVRFFQECPLYRDDRVTLVAGPTQATLPRFDFPSPLDLALIDGPHGYPFPELEYFYFYPRLRPGSILIVDDVHIPTVHNLFSFLNEEEMFERLALVEQTAFFRRTAAPTFPTTGDGWWQQRYNSARFPVALGRSEG